MSSADSPGHPVFPHIAAENGEEDPSRFLATDMDLTPLIRGIEDLGRCNAWLQAAQEMQPQHVDRRTIQALEKRRDYLVEQERQGGSGRA